LLFLYGMYNISGMRYYIVLFILWAVGVTAITVVMDSMDSPIERRHGYPGFMRYRLSTGVGRRGGKPTQCDTSSAYGTTQ